MPDPVLMGIAVNLVSSALFELIRDPLFLDEAREMPEGGWSPVVEAAMQRAAPLLDAIDPADHAAVEAHLNSTEVRQLVRQIYYSRVDQQAKGLASVRQTFASLWGRRNQPGSLDAFALFDVLVQACEEVLDQAIVSHRPLAAHEAKSAARHNLTSLRLSAIEQQLRLLSAGDAPDLTAIDAFAADVAGAVERRHGSIVPPSLYGALDVPLDDLYVLPTFRLPQGDRSRSSYAEVIAEGQRLVMLGNPGAGKTTFAQKLCIDMARGSASLGGGVTPTLILVVLRRYAQALSRSGVAIRDYLAEIARSDYQLDVPAQALEYLLVSGRLGVVFDGLDELPVIVQRRDIAKNIEAFASRYPQSAVIVTSRVVGYEHSALTADIFKVIELADFSREQAAEYARRWFRLDRKLQDDEAWKRAEDLIDESDSVPDLRSNPLMLGLICNLYRGRGFIPRNRPDVYDKCATMLFETWDKHRGIALKPFEDLLRPTMRHLAYWIYSNSDLQAGVTESAAVEATRGFLAEWRYGDDRMAAERAAREFVEFCRGRAWVFSDLGADSEDEALFQFTHRTFLEYFAAEQIVQDHETTAQLIRMLRPRVRSGDWEVVTQLVLQMQQRRHLGAADKIITTLLSGSQRGLQWRRTVLFCIRALQSVVPRQTTVHLTAAMAMPQLAALHAKLPERRDEYQSAIDEILRCDPENRETVFAAWASALLDWLSDEEHTQFALETIVHGNGVIHGMMASEARGWWSESMRTLRDRSRDSVLARVEAGDFEAGHDACDLGWMTYAEAVGILGLDFLWFGRWVWSDGSLAISGANRLFEGEPVRGEDELLDRLWSSALPWFSKEAFANSYVVGNPIDWVQNEADDGGLRLLLLAALSEIALDSRADRVRYQESFAVLEYAEEIAGAAEEEGQVAPLPVRFLLSRGDVEAAADLSDELAAMDLDNATLRLLRGWMLGSHSLVHR